MIEKEFITVGEALGVSLTGIVVVFLSLVFLALAITVISKIVSLLVKDTPQVNTQKAAPAKPTPVVKKDDSLDSQVLAAIVGAINEEEKGRVNNFRIVSITEKK